MCLLSCRADNTLEVRFPLVGNAHPVYTAVHVLRTLPPLHYLSHMFLCESLGLHLSGRFCRTSMPDPTTSSTQWDPYGPSRRGRDSSSVPRVRVSRRVDDPCGGSPYRDRAPCSTASPRDVGSWGVRTRTHPDGNGPRNRASGHRTTEGKVQTSQLSRIKKRGKKSAEIILNNQSVDERSSRHRPYK